jgi:O-antigen/teichoic acid export membrane protein
MQDELTNQANNIKTHSDIYSLAVKGGAWVILARISQQLLSMARLIILARLLAPEDFGLMGVILLTMAVLNMFTQTGFQNALIQKKKDIDSFLNTAWTLGIIRGVFLFALLYLGAPHVALFFDRPQAANLLRVAAVSLVVIAFTNIGTVYFVKKLDFNKQFLLETIGTLVGTVVAVWLALRYRNVWALVLGKLAGDLTRCILSFVMHPCRPSISLDAAKAKELWQFGRHVFAGSVMQFFGQYGDDAYVGKVLGADALGFYQMAYRIANMVATEFGDLIGKVAFPAYSRLQDNAVKLRAGYFKSIQVVSLLVFPITGGIIVLAPEFTQVVLGEKWLPIVSAMRILSLLGVLKCMQRGSVFMAIGRPDIIKRLALLRLAIIVITIYPLTAILQITGTSLCVLLSSAFVQPFGFHQLERLTDIKFKDVLKLFVFPTATTLVTMLGVFAAKSAFDTVGLISLGFLVGLGASVYLTLICLASLISKNYNVFTLARDIAKGLK